MKEGLTLRSEQVFRSAEILSKAICPCMIQKEIFFMFHFLWKKWSKSHRKAKFRGSLLVVGKTIASHF